MTEVEKLKDEILYLRGTIKRLMACLSEDDCVERKMAEQALANYQGPDSYSEFLKFQADESFANVTIQEVK